MATAAHTPIKRTSPAILELVRQAAHSHMTTYGDFDEDTVNAHVEACVAKMATWPESLAIQYLLRDLEPEDFYYS